MQYNKKSVEDIDVSGVNTMHLRPTIIDTVTPTISSTKEYAFSFLPKCFILFPSQLIKLFFSRIG